MSSSNPNYQFITTGSTAGSVTFTTAGATTGTTFVGTADPFLTTPNITCPVHQTNPDNIEYMDGKVVSYCVLCDARIEVARVPGGVNLVHAKELAQRLIVLSAEGDLSGDELLELSNLRHDVNVEQETLDEIAALLRTVEILLDE